MQKHHLRIGIFGLLTWSLFAITSCKEEKTLPPTPPTISSPLVIPEFQKDSAYAFIEKQLSFGTRVPGSPSHKATKDYLVAKLKSFGASVTVQEFKASFLTVKNAEAYNIIASYQPKARKRISLAAHWDSRLIAEKDGDASKKNMAIPGANDGASGVGVLLEIARLLQQSSPGIGIDIILFDAEDQGEIGTGDNWCLGSRYWSKTPHVPNYQAMYGILLDMVGAKNAVFGYEGYSKQNGPVYLEKIWKLAQQMGYGNYFQSINKPPIEDDHYHMMVGRGYPVIDIIDLSGNQEKTFGDYHHTHDDNIEVIDVQTLNAVGRVVTAVIFKEGQGGFQ